MFEWWHWMVLGLCLAMTELAVPAFFIVWFGVGAIAVSIVLLAAPELSIATQLLLWAALSTALALFWFRYLKPRTMTAVGTSASQFVGEVGVLLSNLDPDTRGQVRFQKPVLGSDLWECYAETHIEMGARVRIVLVEGSYIKVEEAK